MDMKVECATDQRKTCVLKHPPIRNERCYSTLTPARAACSSR